MADVETLAQFFHLMNANGAVRVYQEALRCGVLEQLAKGPRAAAVVARGCGLAEGPVGLMLEALRALGLVQEAGGEFSRTPLALALLGGSYRSLGDLYWGHLGEFLKTGVPLARQDDAAQSEAHYAAQAEALAWMFGPAAAYAARVLAPLAGAGRILDVGAGSAIWSLMVARELAGARVTAVDRPAVLQVATKVAGRMGLAAQLVLQPGNYHAVQLGEQAFDLAVVANVMHLETVESACALLRRVRVALKPGGHVAVIDVMGGQAEGDVNRALYALGLALRTTHGRVHAVAALQGMLSESGFAAGDLVALQTVPHALGMLVARRDA